MKLVKFWRIKWKLVNLTIEIETGKILENKVETGKNLMIETGKILAIEIETGKILMIETGKILENKVETGKIIFDKWKNMK